MSEPNRPITSREMDEAVARLADEYFVRGFDRETAEQLALREMWAPDLPSLVKSTSEERISEQLPEWLKPILEFEPRFTMGDWEVLKDHGTARARGLMACIEEQRRRIDAVLAYLPDSGDDPAMNIERTLRGEIR